MNSIINPMWFYWISVFNGLRILMMVSGVLGIIVSLCFIWYQSSCELRVAKLSKILLCIFVGTLIISIFIPSEETMYKMMLSKYATYDNIEAMITTITDTATKIIESIKK